MPTIKKICICSVQIPFVRGGAELFTENLAEQLLARSYQVDRVHLPFQTLPLEEVIKGCLAWRLLNLDHIYNDEIDLVIGTKFPSYMVPHRSKVIWLVHQYREIYDLYGTSYSGFQTASRDVQLRQKIIDLDQLAFSEAKKIFTISKTVSARLKVYNGVDSTPLYPPVADAREFFFSVQEDFVLSVSRLEANKRVHLLIEAMQHVSLQFKAVIVGEGFLRKEFERLAAKLGLADRILFMGGVSRRDLIELYSRAGVLFYGPVGEDYGYATLESFYARKPVITCPDSGGILEIVDGSTGWIAETNPSAIAAAIEDALSKKQESKIRGEAGFQRISHINWNYVLDHLL